MAEVRVLPSAYEREAWAEVQRWRVARGGPLAAPGAGPAGGAGVSAPPTSVDEGGRLVRRAVEGLLPALTSAMSDVAQWRVEGGVARRLAAAGVTVADRAELAALDLEVVDRSVSGIRARYVAAMGAQGATAGVVGAAGMAADLPSLVLCNLRAVGEHGASYGFDMVLLQERLFAAQVLTLSSGAGQAGRAAALLDLQHVATAIARGASWTELDRFVLVPVLRKLAATIGLRLTRRRLGQVVPVLGAAVAGVSNVRFTAETCEAAYQLYRERFLLRKYGGAAFGLPDGPVFEPSTLITRALGEGEDGAQGL